jgi:histidine triad (HIT) family protein
MPVAMNDTRCVFCKILRGELPAHFVGEDAACAAFLDDRPLFPGHTLVVPREHHVTLMDLPAPLVGPLFTFTQRMARAVESALGADGVFVANNNRVSQSVAHLHVHVIPRRKKDGLRGFFWPRVPYASEEAKAAVAAEIRRAFDAH